MHGSRGHAVPPRLLACTLAGVAVAVAGGCTDGTARPSGGAAIENRSQVTVTVRRRFEGAWEALLRLDPGVTGTILLGTSECRGDLAATDDGGSVVAVHPSPLCGGGSWVIEAPATALPTLEP